MLSNKNQQKNNKKNLEIYFNFQFKKTMYSHRKDKINIDCAIAESVNTHSQLTTKLTTCTYEVTH